MDRFVDYIRSFPDYIGSNGRNENEIAICEAALGTSFAPDYREYLSSIGLASFDGREITGICPAERLSVIAVTTHERDINEDIPSDYYVIEEIGVDGIVVWQAPDGSVYLSAPQRKMRKVGNSLSEFYFPSDVGDTNYETEHQ